MSTKRTISDLLSVRYGGPNRGMDIHKQAVGIEVEIERYPRSELLAYAGILSNDRWFAEPDGSLRNHGTEFKSSALSPQELVVACDELKAMLQYQHCEVTERCGVHVHLNFLQHTEEELLNFLFIYTTIEELLSLISGDRLTNVYCTGISESYLGNDVIEAMRLMYTGLQTGSPWLLDAPVITRRDGAKYASVSLVRLFDLGTVEIRLHEGTKDVDRIYMWVEILSALRKAATNRKIHEVMVAMDGEPRQVLLDLLYPHCGYFMKELDKVLDRPSLVYDLFRKGYYRAVGIINAPTWNTSHINNLISSRNGINRRL